MLDITVIILTKNEQLHIERSIRNMLGFAKRVVVVDSFSTDSTKEIAGRLGADVFENRFINYAKQFQWALDNCSIGTQWVMRLDADEYLEEDLKNNLLTLLPSAEPGIVGINFKRKHIFWKRWIKHGGRYPLVLLRLWRSGFGRIEDRWMDEHIVVWSGRTITVDGGFCDENLNDIGFFVDKHNKYATREALDVLIEKYSLAERDLALTSDSSSFQASVKRLIKERIYNRMPFYFSSTFYFLWRYFGQLGFLDGKAGLVYHFMQGYWYRFLVGVKIQEIENSVDFGLKREEVIKSLERVTGHKIQ